MKFTNMGGELEADMNMSNRIQVYNLAYNKHSYDKTIKVFMK